MPDARGISYRYKAKRLLVIYVRMSVLWMIQKITFPFIKDGSTVLVFLEANFERVENELDYLFPPKNINE